MKLLTLKVAPVMIKKKKKKGTHVVAPPNGRIIRAADAATGTRSRGQQRAVAGREAVQVGDALLDAELAGRGEDATDLVRPLVQPG